MKNIWKFLFSKCKISEIKHHYIGSLSGKSDDNSWNSATGEKHERFPTFFVKPNTHSLCTSSRGAGSWPRPSEEHLEQPWTGPHWPGPSVHAEDQSETTQSQRWIACPKLMEVKWSESRSVVSDSAAPWTVAHQAPLSVEFCRQEYWSGQPFLSPGDLPEPGIEPRSPTLHADALPRLSHQGNL